MQRPWHHMHTWNTLLNSFGYDIGLDLTTQPHVYTKSSPNEIRASSLKRECETTVDKILGVTCLYDCTVRLQDGIIRDIIGHGVTPEAWWRTCGTPFGYDLGLDLTTHLHANTVHDASSKDLWRAPSTPSCVSKSPRHHNQTSSRCVSCLWLWSWALYGSQLHVSLVHGARAMYNISDYSHTMSAI